MSLSVLESLKIRAKLLQKAKKKNGEEIQLKDALEKVAVSAGYESWRELKVSLEETEMFNPSNWSAQWKTWFATYEEAKSHLSDSTYLLPYRKQFFICDHHYLESLGIELNDKDLKLVGNDWVKPVDEKAFLRLKQKVKPGRR